MIPSGAAAPAKAAPAASRRVAGGEVRFDPRLLRAREFPSVARRFRFLDVDGQWQDGSMQALPQLSLPAEPRSELFRRSGRIRRIALDFPPQASLGT